MRRWNTTDVYGVKLRIEKKNISDIQYLLEYCWSYILNTLLLLPLMQLFSITLWDILYEFHINAPSNTETIKMWK